MKRPERRRNPKRAFANRPDRVAMGEIRLGELDSKGYAGDKTLGLIKCFFVSWLVSAETGSHIPETVGGTRSPLTGNPS